MRRVEMSGKMQGNRTRGLRAKVMLSRAATAAVCGASLTLPGTAWADITTSLTHRYAFDETSGTTATDSGSAPSNGLIVGGVALGAPGVNGSAYQFNGTNAYVNTNTNSLIAASGP